MARSPGWRWAGLALLIITAAGAQDAAPVDLDKLRREITVLEQIYKLRLTRAQADALLPEMARLKQAREELATARRRFWIESSAAAVKVEYAMLRGDAPGSKLTEQIQAANRTYRRAKDPIDRTVERALAAIEKQLSPAQVAMIATSEELAARDAFLASQRAGRAEAIRTVTQDLSAWARTSAEAAFEADLQRKLAAVVALAYPGLSAEAAAPAMQRLQALYRQVRGLAPRAFNELRPRLDETVRTALPWLSPPGSEDLLMTRAEFIDWLADPLTALLLTKVLPHLAGG